IEKLGSNLRIRHRAALVFAKHAIPASRDDVVQEITNPLRKKLKEARHPRPGSPKIAQYVNRNIGSCHELFPRLVIVEYQVSGIQIPCSDRVSLKNTLRQPALQRGKAKPVLPVVLEHEAHQAVAQPANSVIEDDPMARHCSIASRYHFLRTCIWRRVSDPPRPSAAQAGKDTCPYVDMNAGPYVLVRVRRNAAPCVCPLPRKLSHDNARTSWVMVVTSLCDP